MEFRDLCTIYFLSTVILLSPVTLDGEETPLTGNFQWVLGRIMQDDSFHLLTDFNLSEEQPENELLLYFLPISNSYMYLFTLSEQQEFRLIFPDNFSMFNKSDYHYKPYEFHKADLLPISADCNRSASGQYKRNVNSNSSVPNSNPKSSGATYMLVSTRRLRKFERLINTYKSAPASRRIKFFADILMELTRLRNQRYLADTAIKPWETGSIPSLGETAQGMHIELTAQQFNYYFMVVFRYECE